MTINHLCEKPMPINYNKRTADMIYNSSSYNEARPRPFGTLTAVKIINVIIKVVGTVLEIDYLRDQLLFIKNYRPGRKSRRFISSLKRWFFPPSLQCCQFDFNNNNNDSR